MHGNALPFALLADAVMTKHFFYLTFALCFFPMLTESQIPKPIETITLNGNWQFKQADEADWMAVTLPSSVHTALMQHKKIDDPFYRDNEEKVQWIEEKDWEYEHTFDVTESLLAKQHIDLDWAGLDTYAQVYLNDTLILETNNMFRTWKVDIKPFLKLTGNVLHVYLESPVNKAKPEWDALGYVLPGGIRTMTRKAQYHYGWDWGPKLTGCGIYQKPKLTGWDDFILDDFRVTVRDLQANQATLVARFTYRSDQDGVVSTGIKHSRTKELMDITLRAGANEDSMNG